MRIDIITVLPEMIEGFFNCSIMSRAQKKALQKSIYITCATMLTTVTGKWTIILLGDVLGW